MENFNTNKSPRWERLQKFRNGCVHHPQQGGANATRLCIFCSMPMVLPSPNCILLNTRMATSSYMNMEIKDAQERTIEIGGIS